MACKKQTVPFRGTPEQEAALKAVIADLKSQPGALMPVMQKAQEIYGYLPIEVQTIISDEMEGSVRKGLRRSDLLCTVCLTAQGTV